MKFYVYKNWGKTHARVHTGTCSHCKFGNGQDKPKENKKCSWEAFSSYEAALEEAKKFIKEKRCKDKETNCKICKPQLHAKTDKK